MYEFKNKNSLKVDIYRKIRYNLLQRHIYGLTSSFRVLPDFLVIGAKRCGTTSLYEYLGQHPCIKKSSHDNIGFFNDNFHLGIDFYKSFFPTIFEKKKIIQKNKKFMTYDVTPFYIYHEQTPKRIHQILPNIKLIVILRNPVDRSYSNYFLGDQQKTFEELIADEKKILNKIDKNNVDEYYDFVHTSMLARGFYAEQLETWYKIFPKNQILIIKSEDFAIQTNKIMNEIFNFLGLENFNILDNSKKNKIMYEPMKEETRKELIEYFRPYNKKLYSMINRNFNWEK